ncbi:recombinase RecT [Oceaniradius stylonematis]|uniref:recombinase RecT n=1 Tax=Oceaniradius stylonematis TaxID=2184161 RepID=UPI00273E1B16|nr:recombinase RecT [Oceaniradius stylonematis]
MNEVATVDRATPLMAGAAPKAIVPQDFDGAWRIAQAVTKAGMAPRGLDKPEQAMVAIMHGLEVGFTPMAALQSIAVVNGRPSIWGDGAIALVQSSGKMEAFKEWREGEGDNMVAICRVKRKGSDEPIEGRFSVDDAKKAGLWGKQGPWTQYPKRMLQMRARAFALRDAFADVLRGLGIAEEMADVAESHRPEPPKPPVPPQASASAAQEPQEADVIDAEVIEPDEAETATQAGPAPEQAPSDTDAFLNQVEAALERADTAEAVAEAWSDLDVEATLTGDPDALGIAISIRNARMGMLK